MQGVIKSLKPEKQYGFVLDHEGTQRFFHLNNVLAGHSFYDLAERQRVEFEPDEGEKGPRARAVRPLSS